MAQLPIGSGWHNKKARLITATLALLQNFAGQGEGLMKGNAPWDDRTSAARGGLTGQAFVENAPTHTRIYVALFHSEDYGKWLETVNGQAMGSRAGMSPDALMEKVNVGNFATIHPTADLIGPPLQTQAKALWGTAAA